LVLLGAGAWWLPGENGDWTKWDGEQQQTADQNIAEHKNINDSPEQSEDEDLVNGLTNMVFE